MTDIELAEALRAAIAEAVKDLMLPVKNGEPRPPQVINGYLPPKRSNTADDYPFVIVRLENGTNDREETETSVTFIIGCYSEEFDGHEHCINVMSRIKNFLFSMPNNILADRYVLQFPMSWELVSDQPYPQWRLDMSTKWRYNTPQCIF